MTEWVQTQSSPVPEVQEVMLATLEADYGDLVDRCVDLKIAGLVRWDAIHRRINAVIADPDAKVAPETVQACLESKEFKQKWLQARQDPDGWVSARLRRHQQIHRTLDTVEALAAPTNEDKRTRTANAQFRLGIAGITPQTQVAVGPNAEFTQLVEKMLTKKAVSEGDAPR